MTALSAREFSNTSTANSRIGLAVERLMGRLKARSPHREKFVFQHVSNRRIHDAFQIAEKLDPGVKNPDGSNWKTYRGPTQKQLQVMEATSNTVDELVDRLEAFILKGVDTTRPVAQQGVSAFDEEAINRLVTARVAALLSDAQAMRKIKGADADETVVKQVVEARDFDKLPKGIQRPKSNAQHALSVKGMQKRELKVVKERCDILGIPHDKIHFNGDGSVNRIWLRGFEAKWENYCATHPNAVQKVVQEVSAPPAPEAPQA